jgi:hypothetical protein
MLRLKEGFWSETLEHARRVADDPERYTEDSWSVAYDVLMGSSEAEDANRALVLAKQLRLQSDHAPLYWAAVVLCLVALCVVVGFYLIVETL